MIRWLFCVVVCSGCSIVSNFGAYRFNEIADAGALEQPDASSSSSSTDAGALEQPDASSSSSSTDAGALEQPDASSSGAAGVGGGAGAGGAAGAPDCGVLDPSCHGCAAPTHWCAFQRLCGLPSQC